MAQILVFGDSIVFGNWDLEGGWVQRLRKFVDQKIAASKFEIKCPVFNLGISGDTTEELLERFENEIRPRELDEKETIILISIGINDSIFDLEKQKNWVSLDSYQKNLEQLIKKAKNTLKKLF